MERIFRIGDFTFKLCYPEEISPPENFMKFACKGDRYQPMEGLEDPMRQTDICALAQRYPIPEYTYKIEVSDHLPQPDGKIAARRPDLLVFQNEAGESRLIGIKGSPDYYACYREVAPKQAEITLVKDKISDLHFDPIFTSLLALERQLIKRDSMVLHCAYVEYKGKAILFSAPSETGKTTQANLWEKYRGSRTVNGDRALLGRIDGRWTAQGWPVCGTSEVCSNEAIPISAVVMLSQAKENHAERLNPGRAFSLLYSQITANKWNAEAHIHTLDLIEAFVTDVPVFHLGCTISEEAVECLEKTLQSLDA